MSQVVSINPRIHRAQQKQRKREEQQRTLAFAQCQQNQKWKINRDQVFAQECSQKAQRGEYPGTFFVFLPGAGVSPQSHGEKANSAGVARGNSRDHHGGGGRSQKSGRSPPPSFWEYKDGGTHQG